MVDPIEQTRASRSLFAQDNHLIALARKGHLTLPRKWVENNPFLFNKVLYPVAAILFGWVVPFWAAFLGLPFLLISTANPTQQGTTPVNQFLVLAGSFLPIFLLVWFWLWLFERRPFWTIGLEQPFLKKYLRGLVVGLLLFGSAVGILSALDLVTLEPNGAGSFTLATVGGTAIFFLGWMIQGAAEEVLARGFLLPVIGSRWGVIAGALVSSLLFALLHLFNPNVTFISLLNLALFGFFAALYALFEGGLWGVFAVHTVWNWAQGNLFGFEVSGLQIQSGILIDLTEVGPDWITGGMFGPEGGIVVTIVLTLGSLLVWVAYKRRETKRALQNPY